MYIVTGFIQIAITFFIVTQSYLMIRFVSEICRHEGTC